MTNEPQRTSAGRLRGGLIITAFRLCFYPEEKVFGSLLIGLTLSSVEQNGFANRGQAVTGPYSDSSDPAATNKCEVCVHSIVSRALNIPSFTIKFAEVFTHSLEIWV